MGGGGFSRLVWIFPSAKKAFAYLRFAPAAARSSKGSGGLLLYRIFRILVLEKGWNGHVCYVHAGRRREENVAQRDGSHKTDQELPYSALVYSQYYIRIEYSRSFTGDFLFFTPPEKKTTRNRDQI